MVDVEIKSDIKEIIKKYYLILEKKRIQRGKLLAEEEVIYNSIRNPKNGDVKIIVFFNNNHSYQIFFENKKHPDSYLSLMNDLEAGYYPERRALDHYVYNSQAPKENYNLFLASPDDIRILKQERNNIWKFYSAELGIVETDELPKEEIPKDFNSLSWDEKWNLYLKLNDFDTRKKELHKLFFGFTLKYKAYKSKEEEKFLIIEPKTVQEKVGMIARDIYPINLRSILRRDYMKEHQEIKNYTIQILNQLNQIVQQKKSYFKNSNSYIEYLDSIQKEIQRQILLLE